MRNLKYWILAAALGVGARVATGAPETARKAPQAGNTTIDPMGLGDAALVGAAPGSAELLMFQDLPVVVAAGKREQTQRQAAASVSIVTAEEIQTFGYRSMSDVLRGQRSFYIHNDGLNAMAGVRGYLRPGEWNARILMLVDGRPTREGIYSQTHLDQDFVVPMEAVKRVEVIRGPGSALYGSNAVFGVINVVTRDGADVKNWAELILQGGTQETIRGAVVFGRRFDNGWDIIASGSALSSQGAEKIHYDGVHDAALNFGTIENFDGENASSLFMKARHGDFTITLDVERRRRDNRSATYQASWFDPGFMIEERANLTACYDHKITDTQSFHAQAYLGYYRYHQTYRVDDAGGAYRNFDDGEDIWAGGDFHYDWQVSPAVHLTLGGEAMQALRSNQHTRDTLSGTLMNISPSMNSWAVFVEAEYKATEWLTLVAGLRLDCVERMDPQVCPRFAAIITPTKRDTIKLLYGRAFRAPTLYEMFYSLPDYNTANPNLRPEISDTFEAVWERQWAGGWSSTLNGYFWMMSDAMADLELGDGSLQVNNGRDIKAYGLEAEVSKKWDNGIRLRMHGALNRTSRDGEQLPYAPHWIAGASLAIPVPLLGKRTILAVEPQLVGPMQSDAGAMVDATFLTNFVLTSRDIVPGLDLQIGVYNVFGHNAKLPPNSPSVHVQPWLEHFEPSLMVGLTYRF